MKRKLISIMLFVVLFGVCFSISGMPHQKTSLSLAADPNKNISTGETDQCGCGQDDPEQPLNTTIGMHRTGLLPGGPPLPEGTAFFGVTPASWDWRDATHDGITGDWTTPVRNQLNCGSCYAFAPLACIESLMKIQNDNPSLQVDLSEQFIVSCGSEWMSGQIQGCDGAYSPGVENFVTTYGVLPESCFPYVSGSGNVPPCSNKCSNWQDLITDIDGWHTVASDVTSIKNALIQCGPLEAGMVVYDDFQGYNGDGVYEHPGSDPDPMNHVVAIVGYDDAQSCWICKNSWGTGWGDDGWFRIAYGDCKIGQAVIYFDYSAQTGPQISVTMHRILGIGAIEGWLEGEPDWSYRIQVFDGTQWQEEINNVYSNNENDHTEDITYRFSVHTKTPEITIKFWDRDLLADDLADVSGYVGGGTDDSTTDVRGAIYHGRYNIVTNQIEPLDTVVYDGPFATTSGTYNPDGGQNPDEENDAMVWFRVSDTYEPPRADLEVTGSLSGSVNTGTTHYHLGTFSVRNIGFDPYGLSDSYLSWEIADTPDWGSNWVCQPSSGTNLPSGSSVVVNVYVDVPSEQDTFTGSLKVWNTQDHADVGLVPVQLVTPLDLYLWESPILLRFTHGLSLGVFSVHQFGLHMG